MSTLKRTPLHQRHLDAGAKMVEFAGWQMPVQYEGVKAEHEAVRTAAGLFDVSHMGEAIIQGLDAQSFLQSVTANNVERLDDLGAQYTLMCNEDGGVIDDVIVYRFDSVTYAVVLNAARVETDLAWLRSHLEQDAIITDYSPTTALLSLQGPKAQDILRDWLGEDAEGIARFHFRMLKLGGRTIYIARTGYTGEDGFEIFTRDIHAEWLWENLLKAGQSHGMALCGLGARDTLRLEACYSLYGHELSETINPYEANLRWVVKLNCGPFVGRQALLKLKGEGAQRGLIYLEMEDRSIPREGYPVLVGGEERGAVTSGGYGPTVQKGIAIALLRTPLPFAGESVEVEIRGKRRPGRVVDPPFYTRP